MENFEQPKVKYSAAVEGVKRIGAHLLMLESVMAELHEMHNKTEKIIEDMAVAAENDPAIKDALADGETAQSFQQIIKIHQAELSEYCQRLAKIEERKKVYKEAINKLILSEQWMQKQMNSENHGNA